MKLTIQEGIVLFPDRAAPGILADVQAVIAKAPAVRYRVPAGGVMSVALSGCGDVAWVSDQSGYRYSPVQPASGAPWPAMPQTLRALAESVAAEAGFPGFHPDSALINFYDFDARMGLHQDRDEAALDQPVVSVSLGRAARFRFGGTTRRAATRSVVLRDRDVLVFGGPARLMFHGIDRLLGPVHPILGQVRLNITFRRALPSV